MQDAMNVPVVPVATNLGCFWQQQEINKKPGTAVIEFLAPIETGLPKQVFLDELTKRTEEATAVLLCEASQGALVETQLLDDPVRKQANAT